VSEHCLAFLATGAGGFPITCSPLFLFMAISLKALNASDLLAMDDVERVTLKDEAVELFSSIRAIRSADRTFLKGQDQFVETSWALLREDVETRPAIANTIVDCFGVSWPIVEVIDNLCAGCYDCLCRTGGGGATGGILTDLVTIEVAAFSKGTEGAYGPAWSDFKTDVPALIVARDKGIGIENDKRDDDYTHVIKMDEDKSFGSAHRMKDQATGTIYVIERIVYPQTPDENQEVEVREVPWPFGS